MWYFFQLINIRTLMILACGNCEARKLCFRSLTVSFLKLFRSPQHWTVPSLERFGSFYKHLCIQTAYLIFTFVDALPKPMFTFNRQLRENLVKMFNDKWSILLKTLNVLLCYIYSDREWCCALIVATIILKTLIYNIPQNCRLSLRSLF